MYSNITIQVEMSAGTDVKVAFIQAAELAAKLGVHLIKWSHNEIMCYARANGDADKGQREYIEALNNPDKYQMAFN